MESGVENKSGAQLPGIERCSCPDGYTGSSCEVNITVSLQSLFTALPLYFDQIQVHLKF